MQLKLDPASKSSRILLASALRKYAVGLEPDSRFPSESRICRELGVSRMTLNRAMNDLVEQGILYRRRGNGTFTAGKDLDRIYFVLPFQESRKGEMEHRFTLNDFFRAVCEEAKARDIPLTPLVASWTNRKNDLDLDEFRRLPDGAKVILPGYWFDGLFHILRAKKCKVVFAATRHSFGFLFESALESWYRIEYDQEAGTELAMQELRRCGVKRAVLLDNDNHWLSPRQTGLRKSLGKDFQPELVIYGGPSPEAMSYTLYHLLLSRDRCPFEGILAASAPIAETARRLFRRMKIELPLIVLTNGRGQDLSSMDYSHREAAHFALERLLAPVWQPGFQRILPVFHERESTREFRLNKIKKNRPGRFSSCRKGFELSHEVEHNQERNKS